MADQHDEKQPESGNSETNQRRKALKRAAAGGAVATLAATSGKWQKPVVDAVLLPAHAAASGVQNMRLTVAVTGDGTLKGSPSATAGNTTNFLNSDIGDSPPVQFQVKIHVDPPQATPITLSYDNAGNIDSGPSSPVNSSTNNGGDATFAFSTDDLPDNSGFDSTMNFRATVSGLSQAVVHLDFNDI